ncbi:hypothetical protein ACWD26_29990 [Streptomyces sp. NPDC002787]
MGAIVGREDHAEQDMRTASGLGAAAAAVTLLVAVTGEHHKALWLSVGLLTGAVMAIRRVLREQRHASWIAWAAGAVNALLLSWAEPLGRPLGLPLAAVLGLGAGVLFARWRQHRA